MNKQETFQYLKDHNIPFEITEHPAVYNMEDLKKYMDLTPGDDLVELLRENGCEVEIVEI